MDRAQVIAERLRNTYGEASLDTGVTEPTVVEETDGSRLLVLPREQMPEPLRSLRLIDAAAVGATLVATFRWGDDDTVFVLPYDTRDLEVDLGDEITVRTFLTQFVEHTLGGPRESWEAARSTPISRRLAVVRPWNAEE
jgi:hypothetical protein